MSRAIYPAKSTICAFLLFLKRSILIAEKMAINVTIRLLKNERTLLFSNKVCAGIETQSMELLHCSADMPKQASNVMLKMKKIIG